MENRQILGNILRTLLLWLNKQSGSLSTDDHCQERSSSSPQSNLENISTKQTVRLVRVLQKNRTSETYTDTYMDIYYQI